MAERFRKLPGMDPVMDSALSFAASKDDPASGGRHKVWGSKPLWVLPQTSTIARTCQGARHGRRYRKRAPHRPCAADSRGFDRDLLVRRCVVESRDGADRIQCRRMDGIPEAPRACPVRVLGQRHRHLGQDANGWIANRFRQMPASTISSPTGWTSRRATATCNVPSEHCRRTRRPTFLHLKTARIMGHAVPDFEIEWRSIEELCASKRVIRCCVLRPSRSNRA